MRTQRFGQFALLCLLVTSCGKDSSNHPDAAIAGGNVGCPATFTKCESVCCSPGMTCSGGTCKYPYSTAHLLVYLCPSFNTGTCNAAFFELDGACRPVSVSGGYCYDTGFEISAGETYSLASCTTCDTCGPTISFQAPAGFLDSSYHLGQSFWCGNDKCTAPSSCAGRGPDGGASRH